MKIENKLIKYFAVGVSVAMSVLSLNSKEASAEEQGDLLRQMIRPIADPINFEDPRIINEIHPFFVYHDLNDDFVTGGGQVTAWAAQIRIALTEDLALIANKDGYLNLQADEVLNDASGSLNLEGGLKYAIYKDAAEGEIVSAGVKYQAATGDPDIFQGQGDGIITPFVSAAAYLGGINVMGSTELRIAVNDDDSSFWDVNFHANYPIGDFYPLVELSMFHVYDAGNRLPLPGEGADVLNLGASGADGDTTVNLSVGARYRLCPNSDIGVSYTFPLDEDQDVFGTRWTTDLVVSWYDWTLF